MSQQKHQPIFDTIDKITHTFESMYNLDPWSEKGAEKIFSDKNAMESYTNLLLSHISEENQRNIVRTQIMNSTAEHRTSGIAKMLGLKKSEDYGLEGLDIASQPGSNEDVLAALGPVTIVGMHAKSYMLDVMKTLDHKERSFDFKFEIPYLTDSNNTNPNNRFITPNAYRSGAVAGLLAPEKVTLLTSGVAGAAHVHVVGTDPVGYAELGKIGNAITESGRDTRFWPLAEDIRISNCIVDNSNAGGAVIGAGVVQYVGASCDLKVGGGGLTSERVINVDIAITLINGTTVQDWFTVIVDRDTGVYRSTPSSTGRVLGFQFDVALLNASNNGSSIRAGRTIRTHRITANPSKVMAQPLAMDTVMDEFTSMDGSSDVIKYVSNKFSEGLAMINDVTMERDLIGGINNSINNKAILKRYKASEKLGGHAVKASFDFTKRGPGGERPMSWAEEGAKDLIRGLLTIAEKDSYITNEANPEWVFFGFGNHVARFVDIKYTSSTEAASDTRFGFDKMVSYGFSSNLGQRVKFIGINDSRWDDDADKKNALYGFLRSNNAKVQPTGVYHGYDFRILKSRESSQLGLDAIQFWTHQCWDILSMFGVKLEVNNPVDVYSQIVDNYNF